MTTGIQEEANALAPAMEEIFTTLHQHPELGRREVAEQRLIRERLDALGIESAAIAGTGVVGILRGVLPGRTAALRADVDALPIREETGLSYASRVPGVMHACGHDFHAAALLGAAALLASRRERLPGTVKFFFQPDEEGEGGAERMVAAGCMEEPKVDAVFACHVDSTIPTGTVSLHPGPVCAASDQFAITLRGRGTHGAKPHLGSDVILAASQVVTALQSIPSRRTAPTEPVVVTVGTLHAGSAGNILPEEVRLTGILRTVGGESRERVRRDFRAIVGGTAAAMGAEAEMELTPSYPACRNDGAMTELCRRAAEKVVGEGNVRDADFSLGADDFGYFLDAAPGCYWNVGVRNEERGFTFSNHSPRFAADPGALPVAAAVHAQVVLDFLEGGVWIWPPKLRKGDLVALVAPSSPLPESQPVEAIARAVEDLGFRVRIGPSCRGADPSGYGAATPALQAADLNAAFADPAVRAIWCVRGGSTSWRIVEKLDYRCIAQNPKAFIGFSDVTTLHLAIQKRSGLVTFHGPTANRALSWAGEEDFSWRSLWAALTMDCCLPLENPPGEPIRCLRPGRARGILTGGNLTLAAASLGTPWQIDARGRVLFLEDVGEATYATERALTQLKNAGIFDQTVGVLLGAFTDWHNSYEKDYGPEELFRDFFACYPKPVYANIRSAHVKNMVTLPLGAVCCVTDKKICFTS